MHHLPIPIPSPRLDHSITPHNLHLWLYPSQISRLSPTWQPHRCARVSPSSRPCIISERACAKAIATNSSVYTPIALDPHTRPSSPYEPSQPPSILPISTKYKAPIPPPRPLRVRSAHPVPMQFPGMKLASRYWQSALG